MCLVDGEERVRWLGVYIEAFRVKKDKVWRLLGSGPSKESTSGFEKTLVYEPGHRQPK